MRFFDTLVSEPAIRINLGRRGTLEFGIDESGEPAVRLCVDRRTPSLRDVHPIWHPVRATWVKDLDHDGRAWLCNGVIRLELLRRRIAVVHHTGRAIGTVHPWTLALVFDVLRTTR